MLLFLNTFFFDAFIINLKKKTQRTIMGVGCEEIKEMNWYGNNIKLRGNHPSIPAR